MALVETPATWQRQVHQQGAFFFRSTYLSDTLIDLFFSAFFLQDPAVLTPVPTMGRARSSLPPDEETFSTSTSASASPASRERTAKSVGLRLDVINESDLLHLSCAHKQLLHFHSHQTIFEFYSQLSAHFYTNLSFSQEISCYLFKEFGKCWYKEFIVLLFIHFVI